jgi:uncharacterized protein (DUF1330 family)
MPAYVVGTIRVVDPARWQQYLERVGATFGPHGGTVLFRGQHAEDFNGESHGERIVAIEFPDLDAAAAGTRRPSTSRSSLCGMTAPRLC